MSNYDKSKYSHWAQTPKDKKYLSKLHKGKKISDVTRMKMSASHKDRDASSYYTRGKGGKRKDLDNVYFRNSWEANYARFLNYKI